MRSRVMIVCIMLAVVGLVFAVPSFSQETPKPGTIIDKSNYKKYAHLFPPELAGAFEDGFGGLVPLFKIKVVEAKHYPMPKQYLDLSAKNKGKYGIDAHGNITPAFNREGLVFPDLQRSDKDFATKLMWNHDSNYWCDDAFDRAGGGSFEKRRGEPVRRNNSQFLWVFFKGRVVEDPKPDLANPIGLYKAMLMHFVSPESVKNTMMLSYRFIDSSKPDDTYLYLPSMRRVLRAEATQRSTPVTGSTLSMDDFNCFDGRIPDFRYTLVAEQKILAVADSKIGPKAGKNVKNDLPIEFDNYELRDVYVVDVVSKNPKYPQSKKRIWVDKESLWAYWGVAYDRAGKLWKIMQHGTKSWPLPGGQQGTFTNTQLGVDLQFGMANYYIADFVYNKSRFTYNDVTPQTLLRRAR